VEVEGLFELFDLIPVLLCCFLFLVKCREKGCDGKMSVDGGIALLERR
jgi:hypothetical protein